MTMLNTPALKKLTSTHLESLIEETTYQVIHLHGKRFMVCALLLKTGFIVTSEPKTCINDEDFDEAIGKKIAFAAAFEQLWKLEAYHHFARQHETLTQHRHLLAEFEKACQTHEDVHIWKDNELDRIYNSAGNLVCTVNGITFSECKDLARRIANLPRLEYVLKCIAAWLRATDAIARYEDPDLTETVEAQFAELAELALAKGQKPQD